MSLYENAKCPVCSQEFEDTDDIVTCPDCGTPHHRACYNLVGHCVNQGLHSSDYNYIQDHKEPVSADDIHSAKNNTINEYYVASDNTTFDGSEKSNAQQNSNPFMQQVENNENTYKQYDNDTDTICGESVVDVAATVVTNSTRFIKIFKKMEKTNRKVGWNWSAAVLGPIYLLFRKMYKYAIAFFCLDMSLVFGASFAANKLAPNFMAAVLDFYQKYAALPKGTVIANEDIMALANASDIKTANLIFYAALGLFVLLRIIQGVFADNYYKKTVIAIIKSVTEQLALDDTAMLIQNPIFMGGEMNLSKENLKRLYLSKKGGVSYFMPMLLIFVLEIIWFF